EREYELSEDFTLNLASMIANHQQHHSESQKENKQVNRTKKEIDRDGSPYLYTPADESVKMDDSVTLAFVEKKEEEITQRPTTATTTQETHKPKSTSSSRRPKKIQESEWNQILKDEILKGKRLRRNRTDRKKDRMKSFRNRSGGGYHASMGPKAFLKKRYRSKFLNEAQEKIFELDADKKDELYQKILNSYNSSKTSKKMRRKLRRMRRKH
ncbi:Spondin2like, partial [Caligus rogercresseyi]